MTDTQFTLQDLEKKCQEVYETELKKKLEKKYVGKYVAVEVESGDYFISDTLVDALLSAKEKYPNRIFHSVKIGSEGVFKTSGLFYEQYAVFTKERLDLLSFKGEGRDRSVRKSRRYSQRYDSLYI